MPNNHLLDFISFEANKNERESSKISPNSFIQIIVIILALGFISVLSFIVYNFEAIIVGGGIKEFDYVSYWIQQFINYTGFGIAAVLGTVYVLAGFEKLVIQYAIWNTSEFVYAYHDYIKRSGLRKKLFPKIREFNIRDTKIKKTDEGEKFMYRAPSPIGRMIVKETTSKLTFSVIIMAISIISVPYITEFSYRSISNLTFLYLNISLGLYAAYKIAHKLRQRSKADIEWNKAFILELESWHNKKTIE